MPNKKEKRNSSLEDKQQNSGHVMTRSYSSLALEWGRQQTGGNCAELRLHVPSEGDSPYPAPSYQNARPVARDFQSLRKRTKSKFVLWNLIFKRWRNEKETNKNLSRGQTQPYGLPVLGLWIQMTLNFLWLIDLWVPKTNRFFRQNDVLTLFLPREHCSRACHTFHSCWGG